MQTWISQILMKAGQKVPGVTPQEKADSALDVINVALDGAGIVDPTGVADGANAVVFALRAMASKDPGRRNQHLLDALISVVSVFPFGDLAKLLKARKLRSAARGVVQIGRVARDAAQAQRQQRYAQGQADVYKTWGGTQSPMSGLTAPV